MTKNDVNNYYLDQFDISSAFGESRSGYTHKGVDFNKPGNSDLGMSILSVMDGTVIKSEYSNARGNYITVKGSDGTLTTYEHMQSKSPLSLGSLVKAGQEIGKIGSTGDSTGAHLHLEMQDSKGNYFDPVAWLKGKILSPTSTSSSPSGGGSGGGIQGVVDGYVSRLSSFSWNLVPFLLGAVILLVVLYSMFLPNPKKLLKKVV
jgi:hypothetical protein